MRRDSRITTSEVVNIQESVCQSPHPANIQGMEKSVTRGFQQGVNRAKIPKFNRCRRRKGVNILPLYAPSKRLRYEKQTKTLVSFRLLLIEMLHGGKIFKNHDFREKSSGNGVADSTKG
ncbi:MAG: hypothetical protein A2156_08165 [Deltaproteobacteria bacterium RBG_16_48_10]|nr:MAG: hypothetical protein A2156_08165 [Deltaproteobacteria bacterium RBG_16_48_10]